MEVTIKNGAVYEGICHTCSTDGDIGICLKMARKQLAPAATKSDSELIKNLVIVGKDVYAISAKDVGFDVLSRATIDRDGMAHSLTMFINTPSWVNSRTLQHVAFQTDTAISGGGGDVKERTLQKWTGDAESEAASNDTFGESHIGRWDQFEANERLYGVTTDFNEDDYTVKVDKNTPDYKRREAEASRLASEIEKV